PVQNASSTSTTPEPSSDSASAITSTPQLGSPATPKTVTVSNASDLSPAGAGGLATTSAAASVQTNTNSPSQRHAPSISTSGTAKQESAERNMVVSFAPRQVEQGQSGRQPAGATSATLDVEENASDLQVTSHAESSRSSDATDTASANSDPTVSAATS